ncbi:MAG: hypothetical protein ACOYOK_02335 [Pseudobdellovibrionaceae bacterium]
MAPELALAYTVGLIPSGGFSLFHFLYHKRKSKSAAMIQLQNNLKKCNYFWSENTGTIEIYSTELQLKDQQQQRSTYILICSTATLLSWLGLFFHLIVFFSLNYIAISRNEKKIFSSALVDQDLSIENVEDLLKELTNKGPS